MVQAEKSAGSGHEPPADDCRAQLSRILGSPDFDATDREHRFLGHVVEETLAGRSDRIKAYSIAVEVFGRDVSFDPQTDPIVRIEAGHVRRSLERYYLTGGQKDPILITIPKGAYVPAFSVRSLPPLSEDRSPPASTAVEALPQPRPVRRLLLPAAFAAALAIGGTFAWWWTSPGINAGAPVIPRVLVERFEDLTGTNDSAAISTGLKQEIVGQLSKFKDIIVMESAGAATDTSISPPRFVLAGTVNLSADAFRLRVRLVNRADGSVLWAQSYDGGMNVTELFKAQADIAGNVATSLAQTYGVIFQADSHLDVSSPPDDWEAYACTLAYYAYRADLDADALPAVHACLERAVERFPRYATAWALLSQVYIDEIRFLYPADVAQTSASLARALDAARRAVELDPLNVRGLQSEMFALYLSKDIDAALRVGRQAMSINPNDTELMGEYGYRLALSGNWVEGCPLVAEARQRNPGPFAYYESALALCSYFSGDYPQAVMWIRKTTLPTNPNYHTIAAAVFAQGGYGADAERERIWLEQNAPRPGEEHAPSCVDAVWPFDGRRIDPRVAEESRPHNRGLTGIPEVAYS